MMDSNQLRLAYLNFFIDKEHVNIPSASLLPENDSSTLFVSSGMQPLINYFLGEDHPQGRRIVNVQKCFRSQDIDDIGDNRHTTYFEMLGNWSFGDYFKKDQINWVWQFLINVVGLDPNRLYVSIFGGDDKLSIPFDRETQECWKRIFSETGIEATMTLNAREEGMKDCRIAVNKWDNWWSRSGKPDNMPLGEPGGPCSEIFFDFGPSHQFHEHSQWSKSACHLGCDCGRYLEIGNSVFMQYVKAENGLTDLPNKNVDFGGGLERLLAAQRDNPDIFTLPIFSEALKLLEKMSGLGYAESPGVQQSFRVILDHARSASMLIADGAVPSNKDSGYVVRRLIRRAVRHGHTLGIDGQYLSNLIESLLLSANQDDYVLVSKLDQIKLTIADEEKKFLRTLNKGERQLSRLLSNSGVGGHEGLSPAEAFNLYETFGYPIELTIEAVKQQRPQDKHVSSESFLTEFELIRQQKAQMARSKSADSFRGGLQDQSERTTRYHTATHLLHAALRLIFGNEVRQKGSNITADRLRFDFSLNQTIESVTLFAIEEQINSWVKADLLVTREEMKKEQAVQQGALGFFLDKYPDTVTVYTIGLDNNKPNSPSQQENFVSKEICGGPHVERTGQIGQIKIVKEQSVAAGVRRIYIKFVE